MKFNKYSKVTRVTSTFGAIAVGGLLLSACGSNQGKAIANDQKTSATAMVQMQKVLPTPVYQWSQLRQTLIDIENAQAQTTQTTSFFFNLGVSTPTFSCPSIGFPIASTTELTNPSQDASGVVLPQSDPTGVYAGSSTGTYVICVAHNGTTFANYWEGFVQTVTGPAIWSNGSVRMTGPSTVNFGTKAGGK